MKIFTTQTRQPQARRTQLSIRTMAVAVASGFCIAFTAIPARAAQEAATAPSHNAAHSEIFRSRFDRGRGRIWELDSTGVSVYAVNGRRLLRSIALPGWNVAGFMCPPDIAIDRGGSAWVSSNVMTTLWRVDADDYAVSRIELTLQSFENRDSGFSGLAFDPDGALFAVTALPGSLWRIDPGRALTTRVALSQALHGACALTVMNRAAPQLSLCVGRKRGPIRIDVAADRNSGAVLNTPCDGANETE